LALKEKLTQEDLIVYEIFKNPVLFTEFLRNYDKMSFEEPFELVYYQKELLCDFNSYVSTCSARAVGKTLTLSSEIVWLLVYSVFPEAYVVFTVPNKVHLDPVFMELIRQFRSNSLLKWFISPQGGINGSEFSIKLLNLSMLICRIAGQSGTGANVIGLHTPIVILDEGGYYPWGTWQELQPTLNTWVPGYKLMVSGVPTGLRENNVLYHVDMENSSYTKHRISAFQNPRFSKDDEDRALEQYGGVDGDDYIHFVKGLHGKPVFSLFDRSTFSIADYPVYKMTLNGIDMQTNLGEYINKLAMLPGVVDRSAKVLIGADLGYTEPTAISIMYMDNYGRFKFHARIRLDKVAYPIQERIIDYLDTKFNPSMWGVDKGSAGIGVIQNLVSRDEYASKNYEKRIIPIDFSSQIVLGMDEQGEEIKAKTKPFSVSVLQDYVNNHKITFTSTDQEMISELERMTYSKTPTGDIVYKTLTPKGGKKGEDHFTAALLCGVLAYYLNTEFIMNRPKQKPLMQPTWLGVGG
jgi:hypothetical protein